MSLLLGYLLHTYRRYLRTALKKSTYLANTKHSVALPINQLYLLL